MVFMEFLLRKLRPSTPLSEALLTAMPLLLDTKLSLRELEDVTISELSKVWEKWGCDCAYVVLYTIFTSSNGSSEVVTEGIQEWE